MLPYQVACQTAGNSALWKQPSGPRLIYRSVLHPFIWAHHLTRTVVIDLRRGEMCRGNIRHRGDTPPCRARQRQAVQLESGLGFPALAGLEADDHLRADGDLIEDLCQILEDLPRLHIDSRQHQDLIAGTNGGDGILTLLIPPEESRIAGIA